MDDTQEIMTYHIL